MSIAKLGLMNGAISDESYVKLLECYWGFWQGAETFVYGHDNVRYKLPDAEQRKGFAGKIKDDIHHFKQSDTPDNPSAVEYFRWVNDLPSALGVIYVLEGSTNGAQKAIAPALFRTKGWGPENGAAFYNAYGDNQSVLWNNFVEFLNKQVFDESQIKTAIDSAIKTFEALQQRVDAAFPQLPSTPSVPEFIV
jgi:heme oxygenase